MQFTELICESCKTRTVAEVDANEIHDTYKICGLCRRRLHNRALRPLEFFNLVAIHGEANELHDDFYDYNTGEATQPSGEVEHPEDFPFPLLENVRDNLRELIDFACVEYFTSDKTINLIVDFDKQDILDYLKYKVSYNREINYKCYEIAAKALRIYAGAWIKEQWNMRKPGELGIFAHALAACLTADEAFEAITKELEGLEGNAFNKGSLALCHLSSSRTLDWINQNRNKIINVSSDWGLVAASSQFNWSAANAWLNYGRPLSLIALDALYYCTTTPQQNLAFWLRLNPPVLTDFPDPSTIVNAVNEYLKTDSAPRSKTLVAQIIRNLSRSDNSKQSQ